METFIEYRGIQLTHKPYWGEQCTQIGQGYTPEVWEMQFPQVPYFEDRVEKFEIPYTSEIKTCDNCRGAGKLRCIECCGRGYTERWDDDGGSVRETCTGLVHILLYSSIATRRV